MLRNRSLALKLILLFSFSSILIFSAVFVYNYRYSREIILKNQQKDARNLALVAVNRIEAVLNAVEKVPENLADFLEKSSYGKEELLRLQKTMVEHNQEIFGSAIAFEPYAFNNKIPFFVPYFYRKDSRIEYTQLGQGTYAYLQADWYQIPKELNTPQWIEPYYDEGGGNILMTTYSVPFFRERGGKRRCLGIVTADVSLERLQEIVSSIKILKTGYGFLISQNGTLITHPSKELIMNATLFGLAEVLGDPGLREIGRKMIKGESGFIPFRDPTSSKECLLFYTPIPSTGWSLSVLFPLDELMADIQRLNRIMILMAVAGMAVFSVAVIFISGRITGPLRAMARATEAFAVGNLDIQLPVVKSRDEVGKMASAFAAMQKSLKEYIERLTETTAAKERIESELSIAREIQMSILPKNFPAFPGHPEFDLYAFIEPAREVGGDFYDFFLIDPAHLCFIIADVSGKGVPAALFMAVTKTLIKATATEGITPAEILTQVNNGLLEGNDAAMFVTVFCAVLNTGTGEVLYANAGHNPPLYIKKGGQVSYLKQSGGLVLGVMEGITYPVDCLQMEPGESLFLYTDGVTEAMNEKGELFSEQRLQQELDQVSQKPLQEITAALMQEITAFAGEAPQSDDITMLVLKYRGDNVPD